MSNERKLIASPQIAPQIESVNFIESVLFSGQSARLGPAGNCSEILPARCEPNGTFVVIDKGQRADGLLIGTTPKGAKPRHVFVPWTNIVSVSCGSED